jgi:acyl carrier protein
VHYVFPVDALLALDLQDSVSQGQTTAEAAPAKAAKTGREESGGKPSSASMTMARIATAFRDAEQIRRHIASISKPRPTLPEPFAAPQTELEQIVADAWERILHVDQPGRNDNFFDLGGDSLSAVQLTSELYQTMDVELTLTDLLQAPVLKNLAEILQEQLLLQLDEFELKALVADMEETSGPPDSAQFE